MKSEELENIMSNYIGTEHYYNNPMMTMKYTNGVKAFCENAEAFWLISDINVLRKKAMAKNFREYMFSVYLKVKNKEADLSFIDRNGKDCFTYHYNFTDCPEGIWVFYYYVDENLLIWHGEY